MKIAKVFPTKQHLQAYLKGSFKDYKSIYASKNTAIDNNDNEVLFLLHSDQEKVRGLSVDKVDYFFPEVKASYEFLQHLNAATKPSSKAYCQHDWRHYTGLIESYEYCEKCGEKRG
jgi:hypothetical protein